MASAIIKTFSNPNETIFDPFCGSGTIALEAWISGRNVIANDLNPYAHLLTLNGANKALSFQSSSIFSDQLETSKAREAITRRTGGIP